MNSPTHISVIGAGIAGLTVAYYLKRQGKQVTLIEAENKTGGVLGTIQQNGIQYEQAANTLTYTPVVKQLIHDLNLTSAVVPVVATNNRFILKNQQLYLMPTTPKALFSSKLLSLSDKLILVKELFYSHLHQPERSIATFFSQHFGKNFTETLIDAFVSGVWAGNIQRLSLDACFPELKQVEQHTGSILKWLLTHKPESPQIFNLAGGTQQLIDALTKTMQDYLLLNQKIEIIRFNASQQTYQIQCTDGEINTNHIIVTPPIEELPKLCQSLLDKPQQQYLQELTQRIPYAAISVVTLCYTKQNISHDLNGFGYLVPSREKSHVLGCLFSSSLFPNTCPQDNALLTCFIGGAHHADTIKLSETQLQDIAHQQVSEVLGIRNVPVWSNVIKWKRGIPQYHLGHQQCILDIQQLLNPHAISLHGSWVKHIAVPKLIEQSQQLAASLIE